MQKMINQRKSGSRRIVPAEATRKGALSRNEEIREELAEVKRADLHNMTRGRK